MIAPVSAPAAAPAAAPIDAARTLPVAAPPMIAPVAAPQAAPWPTGVSHDVRMNEITANTPTTMKRFFLMNAPSLTNRTAQLGEGCVAKSKIFKQLGCNPSGFLPTAESVLLFENTKFIQLDSAKQTAVDRSHN